MNAIMNKLICLAVLFFALLSCSKEQGLTVSVKNPTALDRNLETVEVRWKQLTEKLQGAKNYCVCLELEEEEPIFEAIID